MSDSNDRARERVLLALDGLVPLVWLEAVRERGSVRSVTIPSDEEREQLVQVLVMADDLALGVGRGKGSLAALARAIVYLAAVPGGVTFLGRKWEVVGGADGLELKDRAAGG